MTLVQPKKIEPPRQSIQKRDAEIFDGKIVISMHGDDRGIHQPASEHLFSGDTIFAGSGVHPDRLLWVLGRERRAQCRDRAMIKMRADFWSQLLN
jgi:hypothetical protein